jgi:anthranilate synthase/aminodeoxychorismate synthase-like glutamine amidotransferase
VILILDNYDSFTFNLVQYFGELVADPSLGVPSGASPRVLPRSPSDPALGPVEIRVVRNDAHTVAELLAMSPTHIVVSPGPCSPSDAGVSVELIEKCPASIPLLGVCLGHQSIGQAMGGIVERAPKPMHGKISEMRHDNSRLFAGLPDPFEATRYHSLIVRREGLPESLRITAWLEDGLIMGLEHASRPVFGVQFHPESIRTTHGKQILANFLGIHGATAS